MQWLILSANESRALYSTQKSTQLIACVYSKDIQKYGLRPILSPFVEDVNILNEVFYYSIALIFVSHSLLEWNYSYC